MHIFYTPEINNKEYYTLPEDESKHCIRVLRLKQDDIVQLIDGKGNLFKGRISEPDLRNCRVVIDEVISDYNRRTFHLHIAIAPTKNIERFEWFLEKATEIGIDEITPLRCGRSERTSIKPERLERVIIAAMKQSIIAQKPALNELTNIGELINKTNSKRAAKMIAHCDDGIRQMIKDIYQPGDDVLCLIGPEGDFTPDEIELALSKDFKPVTLGNNRLRTETAGIVICENLNFLN